MSGNKRLIYLIVLVLVAFEAIPCLAAPVLPGDVKAAGQVRQREHQYSVALLHGDAKLLAAVLADGFVDTSEGGLLRDKQKLLDIVAHQMPPTSITETDRKIQIYGDTAVVTVKFAVRGVSQDKPYQSAGRATDVWIRRNGKWFCIAAQSSAIQ